MICKKCGGQMPDYAQFCGYCGADMTADAPAEEQQEQKTTADPVDSVSIAAAPGQHQPSAAKDTPAAQPAPATEKTPVMPQTSATTPEPVADEAVPPQGIAPPTYAAAPDDFAAPPPMQQAAMQTAKPLKQRNKAALAVWIVSGVLLLAAVALVLLFAVFPDVLDGRNDKPVAAVGDDRDDDDRDDDDRDEAEEAEAADDEDTATALQPETAETEPVEALPAGEIPENMTFPFGATVGVLLPSYQSSEMEQELIASLSERGAEIVMMRTEGDQSTEWVMMQDLVSQGVDAIIVFPVAGVPVQGIEMAESAGIPVVSGMVVTEEDANTVQVDFKALGKMALATYAGERVLVINGSSQADYTNSIMAGIDMGLEERPDSVIFEVQASDFNSDTAVNMVETALAAYSDIDTIMCFDYVSTQQIYDLLALRGFSGTFISLTGDSTTDIFDVFGGVVNTVLLSFDTNKCVSRCADMAAYLLKYGDSGNETIYIEPQAVTD
jgi:ABC-type sugar transport system substrate-binding protein